MAASFDLTAQLQLQAPNNTNAVIGQIRRQLQGINVPVAVQANARALSNVQTSLKQVDKSAKQASDSVSKLGKRFSNLATKFGAFAIGTRLIGGFSSALSRAAKDALSFQEELVKISQITGRDVSQLKDLKNTITGLSTSLGVASKDLLFVTKTLTQAGFSAENTRKALDILAKTTLTSSFDDLINTTEGAIAVLNQFAKQAQETGDEIKFLESTLGAINAVSKSFAVESNDIISAIRRTGGVFAAAGGEVEELIALFTSVRATTRETAETISVGLRTIFTRLQRDDTVDRLRALGIELRTVEGLFVGPFEAVQRLAKGLAGLDPRDFRYSEIVEELGGIRQIGKLIPLIQANVKAQQALNVARQGANSINEDAEKTQGLLARRIRETSESFDALIRKISESEGFKQLAEYALNFADALVRVADALIPLIPLFTNLITLIGTVGAAKFAIPAIGKLGRGLVGKNSGGKIHRFARGGFVPGNGNGDTVPAMLAPGEFVIRKSSAEKLGADTLNAMNENRFEDGGVSKKLRSKTGVSSSFILAGQGKQRIDAKAVIRAAGDKDGDNELDIGAAFLQPVGMDRKTVASIDSAPFYEAIKRDLGGKSQGVSDAGVKRAIGDLGSQVKIGINSGSLDQGISTAFRGGLKNYVAQFAQNFASTEIPQLPFNTGKFNRAYKNVNIEQIEGGIFEAVINGLSDAPFDNSKIKANDKFDFPQGLGAAGSIFNVAGNMMADAKRTFNEDALSSLSKKGSQYLAQGFRAYFAQSLINAGATGGDTLQEARTKAAAGATQLPSRRKKALGGLIRKFAEGGDTGTDTVPALLTPGEFVINRKAAEKIGYGKLESMNQNGVAKFASGGTVGRRRLASGGSGGGGGGIDFSAIQKQAEKTGEALQSAGIAFGLLSTIVLQTSQDMFGLSDAQAKAAQQAVGVSSALLTTVGTITQLTASMAAQNAATQANTAAVATDTAVEKANTTAVAADTVVEQANTVTTGGFGSAMGAITITVAALAGVFTYLASVAQQEADARAQAVKDALQEKGEQGSSSTTLASEDLEGLRKSLLANAESEAYASARNAGIAAAGAGAVAGASYGASAGPQAAAAGAAIYGTISGLATFGTVLAEEGVRLEAEAEKTFQAYKTMAETTIATATAIGDFEKEFKDAGKNLVPENATPEQRSRIESQNRQEQADVISKFAGQRDDAGRQDAIDILGPIAAKLGKSIDSLTTEDITSAGSDGIFSSTLSEGEVGAATIALNKMEQEAKLNASVIEKVNSALQESAAAELNGTKSFEQLINGNTAFAKNLRETESALKAERDAKLANIDAQLKAIPVTDQGAEANEENQKKEQDLLKQRANIEQQTSDQINSTREQYKQLNEAAAENRQKAEEEAAARAAVLAELKAMREFTNTMKAASNAMAVMAQKADNLGNMFGSGALDFTQITPEDFGDFSSVNAAQRGADAQRLGRNLGPAGAQLADSIGETASQIEFAQQALEGYRLPTEGAVNPNQILSDLGFDNLNLSEGMRQTLETNLAKAASEAGGQPLSMEAVNQIIGDLIQQGTNETDALAMLNELRNKEIGIYRKYGEQIQAAQGRVVDAFNTLVDTQVRNAKFLAKIGVRGEVTRQEKRQAETNKAQFALNLAGTGTRAGDVAGNAAALAKAQQDKQTTAMLSEAGLIDTAAAEQAQQQQNATIAATTAELKRLADQSGALADIEADYQKAVEKRTKLQKIGEDFVFGGQSQREQINMGFQGAAMAASTGTVQNQTEEQRAATLSMLDRLSDVEIGGTGKTGAQIKQQVTINDLQRMGMSREQAEALYRASEEEKRLQEEAVAITRQSEQAAAALFERQIQDYDETKKIQEDQLQELRNINASVQASFPGARQGNQGRGRPQFNALGGTIFNRRGSDTVPAMLTPGEFVMSKPAVNRIGIPTLTAMNNGGRQASIAGGVTYAAYGGEVGSNGGMNFDNMISAMNNLSAKLDGLANITLNHNHTVDVKGLISLGGLNIDTIVQGISQSIGNLVRQLQGNKTDFQAGT
jgi:hypothetical protein